jgi:hypothetical protein
MVLQLLNKLHQTKQMKSTPLLKLLNTFVNFTRERNWTWVWFQDVIDDITWEEANTKNQDLNTIAYWYFT